MNGKPDAASGDADPHVAFVHADVVAADAHVLVRRRPARTDVDLPPVERTRHHEPVQSTRTEWAGHVRAGIVDGGDALIRPEQSDPPPTGFDGTALAVDELVHVGDFDVSGHETIVFVAMPNERIPAIRVIMMPRDTNAVGTIFGGIILSYIDQAGAVEARRTSNQVFVTVAMKEVEFHAPVFVGDLVTFWTETVRVGRTSITVNVTVEAVGREGAGDTRLVTEAVVVYVSVDDERRPVPIVVSETPAFEDWGLV